MTTNVQLQKYINRHISKLGGRHFLGVFASDDLPKNVSPNSCLIVNYSPMKKSSSGHWIAFGNLNNKGNAWYFDSYGFPPDHDDHVLNDVTDFKDFLIKNSSTGRYDYNNFDYQAYGENENECGEWSVSAIVEDWGKTLGSSPAWYKLKSMANGFQRDTWIKKYVGIRK